MLITTGIIAIGTGMLVTIFGIETVMIKKNFRFHSRARGNAYINSSFLNVDHA